MTDATSEQQTDPQEKAFTESARKEQTGLMKRMRHPRLFTGVALILLLVIVLVASRAPGWLIKPSTAPLIITLVTSYNSRQQSPSQGLEAWQGAKLYIDQVNQQGGVNGRQILLQQINDQMPISNDRAIANQVVKSPSLLLLGPIYSSMVPGEVNTIYRDAHLPLITASISSDALTRENSFAFRLRTLTSSQGNESATYVRQILDLPTASILRLQGDNAYGAPLALAFSSTFTREGGHIAQDLELVPNVKNIASQLPHDPGLIFLAMTDIQKARDVIVDLREHHITSPILCSDAIDSDLFPTLFATSTMTDGVYASAPVIYDSAPDAAQTFARQYLSAYGRIPGWFGAQYYEAAQVAVQTLQKANVQGTPTSLNKDREEIAKQLELMNTSQNGIEGLNGQLYFDRNHNEGISQTRFGQFWHGRLRSLPIQLVAVNNPDQVDLKAMMRAGEIIKDDNHYFWKQRVVYAGIDINTVSSINVTNATFTVDFYLWMRYIGNDDATDIAFPNASTIAFDPAQPQSRQVITDTTLPLASQPGSGQRLQYRRYHITGDFKANYDFHDYPFDQQILPIDFQNTRLTSEHLVYVIDAPGLRLKEDNVMLCKDTAAFQSLSSWICQDQGMQYASDTFSSHSTLGDPQAFAQRAQTDYSGLQVIMRVQRKSLDYLISHLLPLLLLFILVPFSLLLSREHLAERLAITVSALLTGAVLQLSINSELPDIGYIVSLDYIYYLFFGLCLLCTIAPIWMEQRSERTHHVATRLLVVSYIAAIAITIICYAVLYGSRVFV